MEQVRQGIQFWDLNTIRLKGVSLLSPAKRDENGKWKMDWSALIILVITVAVSVGAASIASYYGIRMHLDQQDLRLKMVEDWRMITEKQINEHISGYSGDKVNDLWTRSSVEQLQNDVRSMREVMKEIRTDQIRRYNQGFGGK